MGGWGWLPACFLQPVWLSSPPPPARPYAPELPLVAEPPTELVAGDGFGGGGFDRHAVSPAANGPVVAAASCARGAPAAHVAASSGHGGRRVVPPWGSGRWEAREDAEAPRQEGGTGGRRLAKLW